MELIEYFFLFASSIFLFANSLPIAEKNSEFLNVKLAGGKVFEGDIIINQDQEKALFYPSKSGMLNEKYRWPNKTIPYQISTELDSSKTRKIQDAISKIMSVTCLKFLPFDSILHKDFITFRPSNSGCSSPVGRQGGEQFINLSGGCFNGFYTIVHEMLHSLGFYHMQSSAERDEFVKILFENVAKGSEHNFKKYAVSVVSNFGTTYDYDSVMHYPAGAFALENGLQTIKAIKKIEPDVVMGQRSKLSKGDINRINFMYKCSIK